MIWYVAPIGGTLAENMRLEQATGLTVSGAVAATSLALTSTSATALVVGANGATNPALSIDASTASSATGIVVKSAAAAAGVTLTATSSGTNEALTVSAKGTGTLTLGNGSGATVSGVLRASAANYPLILTGTGAFNNIQLINSVDSNGYITYGNTTLSFYAANASTLDLSATRATLFVPLNLNSYTVATLPASPSAGDEARVTDALAPVLGNTVVTGGSSAAKVWYNGSAWTVTGK
jgi:hypothetical protein